MASSSKKTAKKKSASSTPMTHPLYLTADEQKIFAALPDSLKEGWKTEKETQSFDDTPELQNIRRSLAHFSSPALKKMREEPVLKEDDFMAFATSIDFENLSESDRAELLYVLGPSAIGLLIHTFLPRIEADEDVRFVQALSVARHFLLESFLKAA